MRLDIIFKKGTHRTACQGKDLAKRVKRCKDVSEEHPRRPEQKPCKTLDDEAVDWGSLRTFFHHLMEMCMELTFPETLPWCKVWNRIPHQPWSLLKPDIDCWWSNQRSHSSQDVLSSLSLHKGWRRDNSDLLDHILRWLVEDRRWWHLESELGTEIFGMFRNVDRIFHWFGGCSFLVLFGALNTGSCHSISSLLLILVPILV